MAFFRCKMCGGDIEAKDGASSCTCEFCGTQQTIPTVKDEGLQVLFNRANMLRMRSEFDKAAEIYEKIIQRSETEAEAYWGLILCKYGIEYVEDPQTFKRIPTCHRASYDAVTADEDYSNAIKYADAVQRGIYESEAAAIDEIQKGIIALAQKEDPYDVFICYKETDENDNRTQDSVIANDIYYQLTREGFKVFYAAITLEDKLGTEYEPYIFSALNTAKVMLSLGTKPEYFNAVWVKNEWSRFLKIMKKDRSKMLIPCYRDMDPYELPEEFAHLQAQDMSKIGFINDIVRGIKKVIVKEEAKPAEQETIAAASAGNTTANAQIQRGNMALEDHEWNKADSFFEEALNLDPYRAEAYMGKLLAKEKKPDFASWVIAQKEKYAEATTEKLIACPEDTDHIDKIAKEMVIIGYLEEVSVRKLYSYDRMYDSALSCRMRQKEKQQGELSAERLLLRARQYAADSFKHQLEDALTEIMNVLDQRIDEAQKEDEASIARVKEAYVEFLAEADQKAGKLNQDANNRAEKDYQTAVEKMKQANDIPDLEDALKLFQGMSFEGQNGYKDSVQLAEQCKNKINQIYVQREIDKKNDEKKRDRILIIVSLAVCAVVGFSLALDRWIIPAVKYNAAVKLMNNEQYDEAISAFEKLDDYKDSATQIQECNYNAAIALINDDELIEAYNRLTALNGYKDSSKLAKDLYSQYLKVALTCCSIGDTVSFGSYEQDNNTTNGKEKIEWIVLDKKEDNSILVISKYGLDCQQFNSSGKSATWKDSSLRTWLNDTLLNNAFSTVEREYIQMTDVSAEKQINSKYENDPDNATQDKIFLLSATETEKYFPSNTGRKCKPSSYAEAQGTDVRNGYCYWWLRSNTNLRTRAAAVRTDGTFNSSGLFLDVDYASVRPAMWINMDS